MGLLINSFSKAFYIKKKLYSKYGFQKTLGHFPHVNKNISKTGLCLLFSNRLLGSILCSFGSARTPKMTDVAPGGTNAHLTSQNPKTCAPHKGP